MIVEKQKVGGLTVLRVDGVIKLGESARFFTDALKRAMSEDEGHIVVDLVGINYMDSTGIGELVGYLVRLQENQRKLILVAPNDRIRKLLRVANVEGLFSIYDSVEEAVDREA